MDRQFHTQIAARHHDPVRYGQNLGIGLYSGGLFDLRQDRRPAPGQTARLDHVFGALHEGQRQPVDAQFAGKFQILAVLVRQRSDGQQHIGHVHALAVGNRAAHRDGAIGEIGSAGINLETDLAIIDQQRGSGFQGRENLGVRQVHARDRARGRVKVHPERRTIDQFRRPVGKNPDAQLWTLQIGQNGDWASCVRLDLADDHMARADVVMRAMAHVQAEHICTRLKQRADGCIVVRGRAQSGHDLDVSKASHTALILYRVHVFRWATSLMAEFAEWGNWRFPAMQHKCPPAQFGDRSPG